MMTKEEFYARMNKEGKTVEERMDILEAKIDLVAAGLVKLMLSLGKIEIGEDDNELN